MYMLLIATCSAALMVLPTNADTINLPARFYPVLTTDEDNSDITFPKPVTMVEHTWNSIKVSFQASIITCACTLYNLFSLGVNM